MWGNKIRRLDMLKEFVVQSQLLRYTSSKTEHFLLITPRIRVANKAGVRRDWIFLYLRKYFSDLFLILLFINHIYQLSVV